MEERVRSMLTFSLMIGILFLSTGSFASASSIIGPVDITRKIGEDDVAIICPAYGPGAPIWRINGLTYGASSLPTSFEPAYENLLILSVEPDMNNYTFQCFIVGSDSLNVLGSSVGVLSIDKSAENSDYESPLYSSLRINHQKLRFNDKNMTLSWLYSDGGNIPGCSSVLFRIQGWTCKTAVTNNRSPTNPVWTLYTSSMNKTIPISDLMYNKSSVYITLEAIRISDNSTVCIDLNFGFQAIQNLSTNVINTSPGEDVCINVPSSGPLIAVWPYTPINQSLGDCHCPLCDETDCQLELCNCIKDSIYTVTLKPDASYHQLCFNGITEEMNGTYIHFYNDLIHCEVHSTSRRFFPLSPGVYRLYIASHKIIVKGAHSKKQEISSTLSLPKEPPTPLMINETKNFKVIVDDNVKN